MKTLSLPILLGFSALVAAGGCAAQTGTQTPRQAALVRATCEGIMRVGHSAVDLAACTQSLSDSLAAREEGYVAVQSDKACAAQGFQPGTAQFATCVLDHKRGFGAARTNAAADNAPAQLTYDPAKDVGASQGYYDASFDTKRRREEYSCAQLGLDPDSSAFGQCVADLDANLFYADHPNP